MGDGPEGQCEARRACWQVARSGGEDDVAAVVARLSAAWARERGPREVLGSLSRKSPRTDRAGGGPCWRRALLAAGGLSRAFQNRHQAQLPDEIGSVESSDITIEKRRDGLAEQWNSTGIATHSR